MCFPNYISFAKLSWISCWFLKLCTFTCNVYSYVRINDSATKCVNVSNKLFECWKEVTAFKKFSNVKELSSLLEWVSKTCGLSCWENLRIENLILCFGKIIMNLESLIASLFTGSIVYDWCKAQSRCYHFF